MTKKTILMLRLSFILVIFLIVSGCNFSENEEKSLNVRLQWYPQAQFAGYIVAQEKGFYQKRDIKVNIQAAGPDLKPQLTVASGTDDIGIGVPNQIIAARSNGVPLTIIAQIFQDSPNLYILKEENAIDSLEELRGKKVGIWLGGDEAEFVSMLDQVGMSLSDLDVIAQGFEVTPFLEDEYILSQVTSYNELNLIKEQGYSEADLQILKPGDYQSAILGDLVFTMENFIDENPETVKKFLEASIEGWKYTIENPEEALQIILEYNPELDADVQKAQLDAIIELVSTGQAASKGIGFMSAEAYENAQKILVTSGQIDERVIIESIYDSSIWDQIDSNLKQIK